LARVIAVADTFDALTTNRPYQRAHDPLEALRIIQSISGQRLDPGAVAALLAVFKRGEIHIHKSLTQPMPLESSAPAPVPLPVLPQPPDPLTAEITRT
jgi:HD-GYP domain-containing protein (c-di-GMP phosphodiesterase class II)